MLCVYCFVVYDVSWCVFVMLQLWCVAIAHTHTCSIQNIISGKTNTKVFPLPVNAMPIISRPNNLKYTQYHTIQVKYGEVLPYTAGIPCICIGVGWVIPFFFKAANK